MFSPIDSIPGGLTGIASRRVAVATPFNAAVRAWYPPRGEKRGGASGETLRIPAGFDGGERSRRQFSIGDHAQVRLDRIDDIDRKLQFSLVEPETRARTKKRRR